MNILLFLLVTLMSQGDPEFPHPKFVVKSYPETVMPGDTLYFSIIAKNHHAKSIYIMDHYAGFTGDIRIHLKDSENKTQSLLFWGPRFESDFLLRVAEIKPADSRILCEKSINVPPLEDLKEPFWGKHLKELSDNEVKFSFCTAIISTVATSEECEDDYSKWFTIETPIVMKHRPKKEMEMIRKWYDDTPKELFPVLYIHKTRKIPPLTPSGSFLPKPENILVKGKKIIQSKFVRSTNSYPSYPNAPETWQDWKELEESLTASTMRDEIRLTRICIQYCDTEDDTVLKELKEWFDTMNEVQRIILVKTLRGRAIGSSDSKELGEPFVKIYRTICEYDTTAKTESEEKRLQELKLLK